MKEGGQRRSRWGRRRGRIAKPKKLILSAATGNRRDRERRESERGNGRD